MPDLERDAPSLVNPKDIARHSFEVARRGYEQQQVRAYLHELATRIDHLQRTEHELRDQLRRLEDRPAPSVGEVDDDALLERLGEETTRVLVSAREAATEIRTKAEESAGRIVDDAIQQATRTRNDATTEAERRLQEARTEADQILEAARNELSERTKEATAAAGVITAQGETDAQALREEAQAVLAAARSEAEEIVEAARLEGRDMVQEAQTVRERVLRDLSAKRKKARHQIEQLNAGRERLLEAYEVVRSTVDTATVELEQSVRDAKRVGEEAARRVDLEPDEDLAALDAEVSGADLGGLPIVVARITNPPRVEEPVDDTPPDPIPPVAEPAEQPEPSPTGDLGDDFAPIDLPPAAKRSEQRAVRTPPTLDPVPVPVVPAPAPAPEPTPEAAPEPAPEPVAEAPEPEPVAATPEPVAATPEPAPAPEPEPVVLPEPIAADAEPAVPEPAAAWEPEPGPEKASSATAVFARLHESVAQGSPSDGDPTDEPHEPSADELAFQHRTEALAPIEAELAKRLKRALADEQNEVLDALRRTSPTGAADLLQSADQHAARWAEVVSASLVAAAKAGADYGTGKAGSTKDLAKQLAATLTGPLRDRIDRSFEAADGDLDAVADRVRALYREWKMQRLPEVGTTHVVAAYARGLFDAANKGAKVRWVVDPSRPPCPDCDDNVLAGVVVKGEEFPTGNANAPAHPGCHCLVLVHEDVLLTD